MIGFTFDDFKKVITPYFVGLESLIDNNDIWSDGFTIVLWSIVFNYYANEYTMYDTDDDFLRMFALRFLSVWNYGKGVLRNYNSIIQEQYQDLIKTSYSTFHNLSENNRNGGQDSETNHIEDNGTTISLTASMPSVEGVEPIENYADQNGKGTSQNSSDSTKTNNYGMTTDRTLDETNKTFDYVNIFNKFQNYLELGGLPVERVAKEFASLFIPCYIDDEFGGCD